MERVARELHAGVVLSVKGVGATTGVPRSVAAAAAEKAQASRHREGDRHAVVVEAVVLLVRVDPDNREDDRQNGERDEHDPDRHLADTPGVDGDAGTAELPDPISRLVGEWVVLPGAVVFVAVFGPFPATGGSVEVMSIGRA